MAYARAQTIMLLSCKKVCFWLQVREKGRKEAAEWCLVSIRQVWNWCNKDAKIWVSNLFNLADFPNCRPEDLLISHPMPEGRERYTMSDFEVLQTYAFWSGTAVPDKLPGIPFANLDVFEDESILRNRLFYLVPDTSSGELRCFFYLEDNLFAKEPNGDLLLLESSLHLFSL